jgi:hypothetical protein
MGLYLFGRRRIISDGTDAACYDEFGAKDFCFTWANKEDGVLIVVFMLLLVSCERKPDESTAVPRQQLNRRLV